MKQNILKPRIIVITGAESTGKSQLTKELSQYFSSPFFPEYAREYLEKKGPRYSREDVEEIARMQYFQLNQALTMQAPFVFFDTWLIITKTWLHVVYHSVPEWINEAIRVAPIDLFLICDTDISWEPDPLRENGGAQREYLYRVYLADLMNFGFPYRIVKGQGKERSEYAIKMIKEIFYE